MKKCFVPGIVIVSCALYLGCLMQGCGQSSNESTTTTTTTTTTTSTSTSTTTTTTTTTSTTTTTLHGDADYSPHTDGYSWDYNVTSTNLGNNTAKFTYSGTTSVNSIIVQKLRGEFIIGATITTNEALCRYTSTSHEAYGTTQSPTTEPSIGLIFPFNVGDHWTISNNDTAEVVAIEDVTVPLGTYNNCFKIALYYTSSNAVEYDWYAKNIGEIKISCFYPTYSVTYELTAKNF